MFGNVMHVLKKTNGFSKKRALLLFGWMYERYESKFYWFEMSILAEKTILVVVATFLMTDPVLQVSNFFCNLICKTGNYLPLKQRKLHV
jgi:hypothetical protein